MHKKSDFLYIESKDCNTTPFLKKLAKKCLTKKNCLVNIVLCTSTAVKKKPSTKKENGFWAIREILRVLNSSLPSGHYDPFEEKFIKSRDVVLTSFGMIRIRDGIPKTL